MDLRCRPVVAALVTVLAVLLIGPNSYGQARLDIMPLALVQPGMTGVGRTVISGTEPAEFQVKVVAVLKGARDLGDLILIHASGPVIEATGGIASGMSGSPVYVGGKLIGAIAYVMPSGDPSYALLTPIEDMLRLLEFPRRRTLPLTRAVNHEGVEIHSVIVASSAEEALELSRTSQGALVAVPVSAPVVLQGLSGRAYRNLTTSLARHGLTSVPGGRTDSAHSCPLVPGSAIGVQLARGDIQVTAVGTVTYVEGDSFLAFGHPFLNAGSVDLFASHAVVHGVITSNTVPFKVASPGAELGSIVQDRATGILGVSNRTRPLPISVMVHDRETGRKRRVSSAVVREESILSDMFGAVGLSALDGTMERIGSGTAYVTYALEISGRPIFTRTNMFWSGSDIAAVGLSEVYDTVELLASNTAEYVDLVSISVEAEIETARRTARIEKAGFVSETARPGDKVQIEVVLREYRGLRTTKVIDVVIPTDMPDGEMLVVVRGGGSMDAEDEGEAFLPWSGGLSHLDLDDLLKALARIDKNNEVVVEIIPYAGEPAFEESAKQDSRKRDDVSGRVSKPHAGESGLREDETIKFKVPTDWVIQGTKWVPLIIESDRIGG